MDTIVKILNEKTGGDAKTVVEALKQMDENATGDTIAEVLKNMEIGGGGGISWMSQTGNATATDLVMSVPNKEPTGAVIFYQSTPSSIPSGSDATMVLIVYEGSYLVARRMSTVVGYATVSAITHTYDATAKTLTIHVDPVYAKFDTSVSAYGGLYW